MRPGKAPASATSRPVIMGHKTSVKDRSITISGVGESQKLMDSKQKVALQAPAPAEPKQAPVVAPETPVSTAEPKHAEPEVSLAEDTSAPAVVPAIPSEPAGNASVTAKTPEATEPTDISAAPESASDKLVQSTAPPKVDEPEEFDPADIIVSQHSGHRAWVGELIAVIAIIVLLLVIVDILLDAGIIKSDLPHTNFFTE